MIRMGKLTPAEKEAIHAARYIRQLADEYEAPETCRKSCCRLWSADQYTRGLWDGWEWTVGMLLWVEWSAKPADEQLALAPREPCHLLFLALRWMRMRGEIQ